jgi:hypothetical protein
MCESVVAIAFQNVFYSEKHQDYVFLFVKNHFLYQRIKMIRKHPKNINLKQKK